MWRALTSSGTGRAGCAAAVAAVLLAGCDLGRPEPDLGVTRLAPSQSLVCVQSVLAAHPLRMTTRPYSGGWRAELRVLSGAPAGFLGKGEIVHDGRTLAYLPDGATAGLEDARVREAVEAAFDACR